jgi:hypothetical protein
MARSIAVVLLVLVVAVTYVKVMSGRVVEKYHETRGESHSLLFTTDASTYYLDGSHPEAKDDVNHGSQDKPWQTLPYALQQLSPGDTLLIRGGTYQNKPINLTESNSGQEGAPITVRAYAGETVTLLNGEPIRFMGANWWILDGLQFERTETIQLGQHINLNGRSTDASNHVTIKNSVFKNGTDSAIVINNASHISIEGNHFQSIRPGVPFSEAGQENNAVVIRYIGDNISIKGNRFEDIGSDGVHVGSQSYLLGADIGRVDILNNEFWVNRPYTGILGNVGENGVDVKKTRGPILISGNVFHGFRPTTPEQDASGANGDGIIIHNEARNIRVAGNLFYDNTSHLNIGLGLGQVGPENILIYNNIFRDAATSGNPGRLLEGSALQVRYAVNIEIYHNTFFQNPRYLVGNKVSACTFKNNIIIGGRSGVNLEGFSCTTDYNAWSQVIQVPVVLQGEHDIYADDLGLDQDFRPSLLSPVVAAGQNVGITVDFTNRPRGNPPDVGAVEHIP